MLLMNLVSYRDSFSPSCVRTALLSKYWPEEIHRPSQSLIKIDLRSPAHFF